MVAGTVIPDDRMPGRIGSVEQLIRLDFIMKAIDRDVPFALLDTSVINRMGITELATRPTLAVVLLGEPFAVRIIGIFGLPARLC